MEPLLPAGARLLVVPLSPGARLRTGHVVVARRPDRPELVMVKRVIGITNDGGLLLGGDNPRASTESVDYGPVEPGTVLGRARLRYWPLPLRWL
jgi:nickel-type superoxide dismutase maturation protease